jgi:hypothetical protein
MSNKLELDIAYLPYIDRFGLVQPEPGEPAGTSGNGILYTAQAIVAYNDHGHLDSDKTRNFEKAISACETQPGLLHRAPEGKTDQEGPDDYVGAALASRYVDGGALARRVLQYGQQGVDKYNPEFEDEHKRKYSKIVFNILSLGGRRKIKYVYNNSNPGYFTLSAWLGRQPAVIASLKLASVGFDRPKLTLLEKLVWSVSLLGIFLAKKTHHDSFVLDWCRVRTAQGSRSKLVELVSKIWRWRFTKVWGNPGDLLADYFKNPQHPNAIYLRNS